MSGIPRMLLTHVLGMFSFYYYVSLVLEHQMPLTGEGFFS